MINNGFFDVNRDGFQCLTIPRSGRYKFEVIGASFRDKEPGARIIGEVRLKKGEKITVALGQTGNRDGCGTGGTFVVKESGTCNPRPLFVAGGAGFGHNNFSKASLSQTASGNDKFGSSRVQKFIGGHRYDIYKTICSGAGFSEAPVTWRLRGDSEAPKCHKDGLIGGKIIDDNGRLMEGGFGGGGASYYKNGHYYSGAGGGYTGGGTRIYNDEDCDGGGGGSFSIDEEAQFDHAQEIYGKCTITYLDQDIIELD